MNGSVALTIDKLREVVTNGNDSKDRLLQTANSLTSELEEILTFVNITDLNSKILQLRDNTSQLTGMVVKNFNGLNEFFNTQIEHYSNLGQEAGEAAASVNSSIGG